MFQRVAIEWGVVRRNWCKGNEYSKRSYHLKYDNDHQKEEQNPLLGLTSWSAVQRRQCKEQQSEL